MYEIVLSGVYFVTKIAASTGPEISIFKKFQSEWENINQKNYSPGGVDPVVMNAIANSLSQYY